MHRLTLIPLRRGMYAASYEDRVIVSQSRQPALDACRVLLQRGIEGELQVYGADGKHRLTVDIRGGAALDVKDGAFVARQTPTDGPTNGV
jgi:hypothetical protein